jgi:hypothetical protein
MARRRRRTSLLTTILRAVKKTRTTRKRKRKVAVRAAKRASVANQKRITRESRTTAGALRSTGQYVWEGDGLPDATVMEPVRTTNGWEWVPAKQQPAGVRRQINTYHTKGFENVRPDIRTRRPGDGHWAEAAKTCGAPTKDNTPCERTGDCPIQSHRTWRKANGR